MQLTEIVGFVSYIIAQVEDTGILNYLQQKFVAGGGFMWPILASLVIGLGFCFERMWTLSRASMNTRKFIVKVKDALTTGGVEEAMKVCENTRGSIASVFHAGLLRADEGIEAAEKAIMAYGAIEMGFLERGLIWISTFITIAPMLGFTGTVQGMIEAFDAIAEAAQISPGVVAGGISVALLTTLFGLVTAMILQVFYNFFVARIDKLVADMEESSIELIDALYEIKKSNKN
ncbi:MotA/TolQ/ExbB proton channel family protein [Patescibacteria group bacterium]|nr:MotA/TolQ/ExbB proton channel family protein [Patescibacteria group bacterium]MBU1449158.1 MotA/TolQ/ExbB proton channel family protein [Patescibacteria group bacterium]MBU2494730.1 MotA/TolQ/ExbB proton channel family protein [Bacteroidota bacterium]